MAKLPQITGAELVCALRKAGFEVVRQRGSHVQLRREEADGTVTTFPVPVHSGKSLKKGTLSGSDTNLQKSLEKENLGV
ncbi:MAG: hypothetical protein BRC58_05620 [Cyanobacteria bacterium QS_8_64_29]|nr:MAG: hypothetical protein BRC58_05620 [Cyanobacteria bacterium QS_8_64_29]